MTFPEYLFLHQGEGSPVIGTESTKKDCIIIKQTSSKTAEIFATNKEGTVFQIGKKNDNDFSFDFSLLSDEQKTELKKALGSTASGSNFTRTNN